MKYLYVLVAFLMTGCAIGYAPGIKPTNVGRDNDKDSILTGVRKDADLKFSYITHEFSFVDRDQKTRNFFRESFGKEPLADVAPIDDYFLNPLRAELVLRVGTAGKLNIRRENTIRDIEINEFNSIFLSAHARYPFLVIPITKSGDVPFGLDTGLVWDAYVLPDDVNVQGDNLIADTYTRLDAEIGAGIGFRVRKTIGAEAKGAIALVNPVLNLAGGALGDNDALPVLDANGRLALIWRPIPRVFGELSGTVGRGIVDGSRLLKESSAQIRIRYVF